MNKHDKEFKEYQRTLLANEARVKLARLNVLLSCADYLETHIRKPLNEHYEFITAIRETVTLEGNHIIKITVTCVKCGHKMQHTGSDRPFCGKCGGVMLATKASTR